jgi:hypothetical protein
MESPLCRYPSEVSPTSSNSRAHAPAEQKLISYTNLGPKLVQDPSRTPCIHIAFAGDLVCRPLFQIPPSPSVFRYHAPRRYETYWNMLQQFKFVLNIHCSSVEVALGGNTRSSAPLWRTLPPSYNTGKVATEHYQGSQKVQRRSFMTLQLVPDILNRREV